MIYNRETSVNYKININSIIIIIIIIYQLSSF